MRKKYNSQFNFNFQFGFSLCECNICLRPKDRWLNYITKKRKEKEKAGYNVRISHNGEPFVVCGKIKSVNHCNQKTILSGTS